MEKLKPKDRKRLIQDHTVVSELKSTWHGQAFRQTWCSAMRKARSIEAAHGADVPPLPNVMSVCYYYPHPVGGTDIGHHGYHSLGLGTKHFSKYLCLFHRFLTAILWCRHWYYLPSKTRALWHSDVKEFAQHYIDGKRWGQRSTSGRLAPWPRICPSLAHWLCREENVKGFPG